MCQEVYLGYFCYSVSLIPFWLVLIFYTKGLIWVSRVPHFLFLLELWQLGIPLSFGESRAHQMTRFEWKRLIWFRPGSIEIFDRVPLKCWVGWFWSDSKGQSPSSLQFWEIALQTSIFSCQHNHERGLVISVSGISFCSYLIIVWLLRIRHLLNP